jgi:hypothetical protein
LTAVGPRALVGTVLVAATLLVPAAAAAYSIDGKLGLGFEETLTAVDTAQTGDSAPDVTASGITLAYYIGHLGIEFITGGQMRISAEPLEWSGFVSLGVHYNVFHSPSVNFSIGARGLGGVARAVIDGDPQAPRFGTAIELPMRVTYFLSSAFAFSAGVGPVFAVNGAKANPLTGRTDSVDVRLFRGGFRGGLGFLVFFE